MNVGLCFNLKKPREDSLPDDLYAEWDDEETIEAVRSSLSGKHRVMLIEGDEEAFVKFRRMRPDIVFNMAEGLHGASREAQIPYLLEMLGIARGDGEAVRQSRSGDHPVQQGQQAPPGV